jgi:hypothetical protein
MAKVVISHEFRYDFFKRKVEMRKFALFICILPLLLFFFAGCPGGNGNGNGGVNPIAAAVIDFFWSDLMEFSAKMSGIVNPNGSSTTCHFEYGPTTSYGTQTSTVSIGSGTSNVTFTIDITGLTSYTTYHIRLVATNSGGTTRSSDKTFQTLAPVPVLSSISPTSRLTHAPTFILTATGTGFVSDSKIVFDGNEKDTTYVNETTLTCQIEPEDTDVNSTLMGEGVLFQELNSNPVVDVTVTSPGGLSSTVSQLELEALPTVNRIDLLSSLNPGFGSVSVERDSSDTLHVFYTGNADENVDAYYLYSTDSGSSFSPSENITQCTGNNDAWFLSTSLDDQGRVSLTSTVSDFTTWYSNLKFYPRISDGFRTPIWITDFQDKAAAFSSTSSLGDTINITALTLDLQTGYGASWFIGSTDAGSTWNPPIQFSPPSFDVRGGASGIRWANSAQNETENHWAGSFYDTATQEYGINFYSSHEIKIGLSYRWAEEHAASTVDLEHQRTLDIFDLSFLKFCDLTHNLEVNHVRSTDGGMTWMTLEEMYAIYSGTYQGAFPEISQATDTAGNLNIVFTAYNSAAGRVEPWYMRSTDGMNFTDPISLFTTFNLTGDAFGIDIVTDKDGYPYVITSGGYGTVIILFNHDSN